MGRSADYTIQGFLYQFNQTLTELLNAEDEAEITIEGIVEDIEVATFNGIKAIQCKYHETQDKYNPSILYAPLLQMMKHFKSKQTEKIKYCLFVYFPNEPRVNISAKELNNALKSKNRELQQLIVEAKDVDIDEFLKVFTIKLTKSYDDLVKENVNLLVNNGFNKSEVETLSYPNSIQIIADLSIKHDEKFRKITKKVFLEKLYEIKSTAISRWTLALKTRQKILTARCKQLKKNLNLNVRLRFLVIFPDFLEKFDSQIVLFIKSFVDKYHFKQVHTQTPFFILDVSQEKFDEISERLTDKDVKINLGRPANNFSEMHFFRDPMVMKEKKEFVLRLIRWDEYKEIKNKVKADDFFVIGDGNIKSLDLQDVNIEEIGAENFNEIKFVMGIIDGL